MGLGPFESNIYHFHLFAIFVYQGVYARHLRGNASAPNAAQFHQCVEPLAKVALQIAQRLVAVVATRVTKSKCLWMFLHGLLINTVTHK